MNAIEHAKKTAVGLRRLATSAELNLSEAREAAARILGYRDWHHVQSSPGTVTSDTDGRRWRTMSELSRIASTADPVTVAMKLFPGGAAVVTSSPERPSLIDVDTMIALAEGHHITRGYGQFLRTLLGMCPWGLTLRRNGEEAPILVAANIDPANRFVDDIRGMGAKYADAFLSMTGIGPEYDDGETHLAMMSTGIHMERRTGEMGRYARPGYRLHIAPDGTSTLDLHVLGFDATNDDLAQALSVWAVERQSYLVDTLDIEKVVDRDDGATWLRVGQHAADGIIGQGRENMHGIDLGDGRAVESPKLDYWTAMTPDEPLCQATRTLMARETEYGSWDRSTRHEVARAGRHLASLGIDLPDDLASAWLNWGTSAGPVFARKGVEAVSIRDDGKRPTDLERGTKDGVVVVLRLDGPGGPALAAHAETGWGVIQDGVLTAAKGTRPEHGYRTAARKLLDLGMDRGLVR